MPEKSLADVPGGEEFHIDDGKKTLKFFLYLTDVTQENGPFCYIPKSHGILGWRKFFRIIKWNIFNEHFSLYFDEKEIKQKNRVYICQDHGIVFCADTTGFHKATPLLYGQREILVVSFNEKRLDLVSS